MGNMYCNRRAYCWIGIMAKMWTRNIAAFTMVRLSTSESNHGLISRIGCKRAHERFHLEGIVEDKVLGGYGFSHGEKRLQGATVALRSPKCDVVRMYRI